MPNTIHIALASDDNYFVGLLTTAWSIARNCSRPHKLIVNILDGGISPVNWNYLVSRLTPTKCTIRRLPINQDTFEGFQSFHGTGKMTYARLLLPDLLSDVTHVIYTDVDILWLADIAELWDSIDEDAIMHISPGGSPPEELKWFSEHNYKWEKDKPFCAGMVIMNLAKFRREKLHLKMLDTITLNGGALPLADQTAMNVHMFGRTDKVRLDPRWQLTSGGQAALSPAGFVIHFCGDAPWKSVSRSHHMITDQHLLWHRYHAEAHEETTWSSLHLGNTTAQIVIGRLLYILAVNLSPVRTFLHLVMIMKGKGANIPCLDYYLHKFKPPRQTGKHYW